MFTDRFDTETMLLRAEGIPAGRIPIRKTVRVPENVLGERSAKKSAQPEPKKTKEKTGGLADIQRKQRSRTLSQRNGSEARSLAGAKRLVDRIRESVETSRNAVKTQTAGLNRSNAKALLG